MSYETLSIVQYSAHNIEAAIAASIFDEGLRATRERNASAEFLKRLASFFQQMANDDFLHDRGYVDGVRMPSFKEAINETIKRVQRIERLTTDLPDSVVGIVIGGSMSYGKFYNIRGEHDASDIDIFYIAADDFFLGPSVKRVFSDINGFSEGDSDKIEQRAIIFRQLYERGIAGSMSHKFSDSQGYLVSVKILPYEEFVREFNSLPREIPNDGRFVTIDYKQGPYDHLTFTQYSMDRKPHQFNATQTFLPGGETLVEVPAMLIKNGRMITGDHQNHLFPFFDAIYDPQGTIQRWINEFHNLIRIRGALEANIFGHAEPLSMQDRIKRFSPVMLARAKKQFKL